MKEDKDRRSSSPTEEKSLLLQLWDMIAVTASLGFTLAVCLIAESWPDGILMLLLRRLPGGWSVWPC